jgi:hypothetical protein
MPLLETPLVISAVTRDEIDAPAQFPGAALRYTAGVRMEQYGLDNRYDRFLLRGWYGCGRPQWAALPLRQPGRHAPAQWDGVDRSAARPASVQGAVGG